MKTCQIATIPGDGIGKEVVPAGQQVLEALASASSDFRFQFQNFDWGGDYFRAHGVMMPEDGLEAIKDASPIGTFWSVVMMLEHLGERDAARRTQALCGLPTSDAQRKAA